jgi:hypothetical protein
MISEFNSVAEMNNRDPDHIGDHIVTEPNEFRSLIYEIEDLIDEIIELKDTQSQVELIREFHKKSFNIYKFLQNSEIIKNHKHEVHFREDMQNLDHLLEIGRSLSANVHDINYHKDILINNTFESRISKNINMLTLILLIYTYLLFLRDFSEKIQHWMNLIVYIITIITIIASVIWFVLSYDDIKDLWISLKTHSYAENGFAIILMIVGFLICFLLPVFLFSYLF